MEVVNPLLPLAIVIGICIIQWLRAKRATRALEAKRALQAAEKKKRTTEAIQSHQESQALEADRYSRAIETKTGKTEHQRAMQLVYDGLSNVMAHLLSPNAFSTAPAENEIATCPNCKSAWDNAFNFCLKCSYTKN